MSSPAARGIHVFVGTRHGLRRKPHFDVTYRCEISLANPDVYARIRGCCLEVGCPMSKSRAELVRLLSPYAQSSTPIGLGLLAFDILQYAAAIAGVLCLSPILAKLACGIYAGVRLGSLLILAHDAAHQCLVRGRRRNKLLAVIAFVMCLHNYRLWIIDHHGFHHPNTNGGHKGTYTPFSLDTFRSLPSWRRQLERFYRSGNPFGMAVHYFKERWLHALFLPNDRICPEKADEVSAWRHAAVVIGYLAAWLLAMLLAPQYSETSASAAVGFGFVVPLVVFHVLVGFVEFAQHTHPNVGWFQRMEDKPRFAESELVSVHLKTSSILGVLMHHVLDHPVHHVHARVPCYRLRRAQQHLNELLGARAVVDNLSLAWYIRTIRTCKLFDFAHQRWLDFDGTPTQVVASRRRVERESLTVAERGAPCPFEDRRLSR